MASVATTKDNLRQLIRHVVAIPGVAPAIRRVTQSGLVSSQVWMRLPVARRFTVPTGGATPFSYISSADDQIGRSLFWRGLKGWEAETLRVFRELCKKCRLVIDVGANTGAYTLLACGANPNLHVISIEPVPAIFGRLTANVRTNGWTDRWTGYNVACSDDSAESVWFHVPEGEVPTSGCLDPDGFRGCKGELIRVPLRSVDSLVPDGRGVDLVKIDVEGFEDHVLQGMRRTLAESAPAIIVEANPDGPYIAVESILREYGYRFWSLQASGPEPADHIHPYPSGAGRNYLCQANRKGRSF